MRLSLAATLSMLTLSLLANPALAQSEEDVWSNIETIHGDADGFFALYGAMQDIAMSDDPTLLADYALYPLLVNANGESYDVLEAQDLIDDFDSLVYPETLDALLTQDVADLIVTSEGVGIGNGAIWVTNVCLDDACAETQWGILSINN
ncbi:hypothetical protein [Devosia chinhatensis]|uniref:Uncharacterized protein n=1 Tax=Devosia chinhatensis TaxID=429727 RepID=A0A0F5FNJ4_9HYPH|nr:hypothetical protein [Devosia chinhatensis]KKB10115.1 hypothetical protein VE26_10120 [Devosia chinhatensis]